MKLSSTAAAVVLVATVLAACPPAEAFHHPTAGRWTQRDPVGYVDGMSLYQYVRSSPITEMDPAGLRPTPGFKMVQTPDLDIGGGGGGGGGEAIVVGIILAGQWLYNHERHVQQRASLAPDPATDLRPAPQLRAVDPGPAPAPARRREDPCCKKRWGPRLGGDAYHNQIATYLSGRNEDYYVETPEGAKISYDGRIGESGEVFELKTGHEWLPGVGEPWTFWKAWRGSALWTQFGLQQLVAYRCGLRFQVYAETDETARKFTLHFHPDPLDHAVWGVAGWRPGARARGRQSMEFHTD